MIDQKTITSLMEKANDENSFHEDKMSSCYEHNDSESVKYIYHKKKAEDAALIYEWLSEKSNRDKFQELEYKDIAGSHTINAPIGFEFCDITKDAWIWIVNHSRTLQRGLKTKREEEHVKGRIYSLAQILSHSLGLTVHYWESEARKGLYHN